MVLSLFIIDKKTPFSLNWINVRYIVDSPLGTVSAKKHRYTINSFQNDMFFIYFLALFVNQFWTL